MIPLATVEAFCRRWFSADPVDLQQLTVGTFNETARVRLSSGETVILRLGPKGDDGIRNGAAALERAGTLDGLAPRTLALDTWADRTITAQSVLPGSPASDRVPDLDDERAALYFRDLGRVTREVHDVRGERFGSILNPEWSSWSDAIGSRLEERVAQYDASAIDSTALRMLLAALPAARADLDRADPRLLHGDLWSLNILLDDDRISGIVDWDTANWGDPVADWTIHRIRQRVGTAADAFWDTYGELPEHAEVRSVYGAALNTAGSRLDIERRHLAIDDIPPEHWDLDPIAQAAAALGLR